MAYKLNPLTGRLDFYEDTNGFVKGIPSTTINAIPRWNDTTAGEIKNSLAIIQDGGALVAPGYIVNKVLTTKIEIPNHHVFITSGITIDTGGELVVDSESEIVIV